MPDPPRLEVEQCQPLYGTCCAPCYLWESHAQENVYAQILPNETVEKPYFQTESKSGDGTIDKCFTLNVAEPDCAGLDQCSKSVDFADIVNQRE